MERSIPERIEAEIRRGKIGSAEVEEAARLERWFVAGAPRPGEPAERFSQSGKNPTRPIG